MRLDVMALYRSKSRRVTRGGAWGQGFGFGFRPTTPTDMDDLDYIHPWVGFRVQAGGRRV